MSYPCLKMGHHALQSSWQRCTLMLPRLALAVACVLLLFLVDGSLAGAEEVVPPEFQLAAENDALRFYVHPRSTQIIVEDKRNGRFWSSNPVAGLNGGSGPSSDREQAVFFLLYTDARRGDPSFKHTLSAEPEIGYAAIDRGIWVEYRIPSLDLQFDIVYQLGPDYLEVRVPQSSMAEMGENVFAGIDLLPYFGAITGDTEGYFMVPDGPGALIRTRPQQPKYRRRFEGEVYGPALLSFESDRPASGSNRRLKSGITMPVFGEIADGAGFLAILTQGATDTEILIEMSTRPDGLNRASPRFIYRRQAEFPISRAVLATKVEDDRIPGDHTVRFVFLPGPDASYVDMAKVYREYLLSNRGVDRLTGPTSPLHLRLFMGVEKWAFPFSEFISMTTFDQAISILETLERRGVEQIVVTLVGWEDGGYGGRWPYRLPPDARLGGWDGLRRLAEYSASKGHLLVLEDQYLWAQDHSGGLLVRDDAIRALNRLPMVSEFEPIFLLNSVLARLRHIEPVVPQLTEAGVAGVLVQGVGTAAMADYNRQNPQSRLEFVDFWRDTLGYIKEQTGWVGVVGSNDYTLGSVDHLAQVPLDRLDYEFFEETVPFVPIVIHGLVTYSGTPQNLMANTPPDVLRQLEYGALPTFELTYESPWQLGPTIYNDLSSSEYDVWLDDVVAAYLLARDRLGHTWGQFIIDHQQLAPRVFSTTYEDGTRVIVNYGGSEYREGTLTVPAGGYEVQTNKQ